MHSFDAFIVGGGPVNEWLAGRIASQGKKVGLVTLQGDPETYFLRLWRKLKQTSLPDYQHLAYSIDPLGSFDRFEGPCRFEGPHQLRLGNQEIRSKRFVIGCGARPRHPAIQGLDQTPFSFPLEFLEENNLPASVIIIGAGPIGISLAQFVARSNRKVVLLNRESRILPSLDPDSAAYLHEKIKKQGIEIVNQIQLVHVRKLENQEISVVWEKEGQQQESQASSLVLATGTEPALSDLNLTATGMYINKEGFIVVNEEMETAAPHIWAYGFATSTPAPFSTENAQADIISNNIVSNFLSKKKFDGQALPVILPSEPPYAYLKSIDEEKNQLQNCSSKIYTFEDSPDSLMYLKLIGSRRGTQLLGVEAMGGDVSQTMLFFQILLRAEISIDEVNDSQHYARMTDSAKIFSSIHDFIKTTK
jgi:mercuric reductase